MKVTYIYHSGFLIGTGNTALLFDYYRGRIPSLPADTELLVFASHGHGDHFNPDIFRLADIYPKVRYYLSDDIRKESVPENVLSRTVFVGPWERITEEAEDGSARRIETLKSNDLGVAFTVEAEGHSFYHAGDLNDWWWDGGPEDLELQDLYRSELSKIRGRHFDAAFIPLDPRLQRPELGIADFLGEAGAEVIFPMHFWDDIGIIERMLSGPEGKMLPASLVRIHGREECFEIGG